MCASPQPRSPRLYPSSIQESYITIQVSRCSSHLHSGRISAQPRSYDYLLNSIKVTSQLHPGFVDWISSPSRSNLNAIQVSRFVSHLHPDPASPTFKSQDYCVTSIHAPSKFHLGTNIRISPSPLLRPSRSRYSHLTTIQVTSHLNPGHDNWILDVFPLQLIQVSIWLSQLNPYPISPSAKSQDLYLTFSQAPRFMSPLHLGRVSTKFRSLYLCFTSISVTSHLQPGPQNSISAPSKPDPQNCIWDPSSQHLKLLQVSRCVSQLHADHV